MYESQTKTELEALAEFVRQETDGGREIMRFFLDVMRNRCEDAKMSHRFAAASALARHGSGEARDFLRTAPRSRNGRAHSRTLAESAPIDDLADFIRLETDDGKEIVRFLLDVMRNRDKKAGMGHRVSAAKELLKRAFDDVLKKYRDEDDQHRGAKECKKDTCEHTIYARDRMASDGRNTKALVKIYGSKEAVKFAWRAVNDHRRDIVFDPAHVPDHDFTPIENPEDDPYGKGSYGYEVLCDQFGDNQAIRVANKAAEEFNRQFAGNAPETADSEPVRDSQHVILNEAEGSPAPDPPPSSVIPDHPHDTPVGEGFKLSQESPESADSKPAEHPETAEPVILSNAEGSSAPSPPPSSVTPDDPHEPPADANSTDVEDQGVAHPSSEPQTHHPQNSPVGEGLRPSLDPTNAILGDAGEPPAPEMPRGERAQMNAADPPGNDPPTPEPLRRSGRRRKHRLSRRILAVSSSGSVPARGSTSSDRQPPPL